MASYFERLRMQALAQPGAWADNPWGEDDTVYKAANKKIFLFLWEDDGVTRVNVKLTPDEVVEAHSLPFVRPVRYLSKKHWVGAQVTSEMEFEVVSGWLDRSYELVAPKTRITTARKPASTATQDETPG